MKVTFEIKSWRQFWWRPLAMRIEGGDYSFKTKYYHHWSFEIWLQFHWHWLTTAKPAEYISDQRIYTAVRSLGYIGYMRQWSRSFILR